ncbi:MAG: hypothetical protein IZT56_08275 [Bacteroidetes bacterium]|nr:hypothetical protein [Bacteroidota bacterium]
MKSINTLFFLGLFLVVFTSCQNEIVEIVQPSQDEVLQANSNVAALVQRTVTKDGSKDNIIDNASCISIQLPVTVVVRGIEITLDSDEDLEVIEDIFDEFDDDIDDLDIVFPIVIILSDFTEITINNFNDLEGFINECEDENEIDDDIECMDFVYPITMSIFDSANQLAETITIENDEHFYKFMDGIEDHHLVQINFPITVVLYDGSHQTINHMNMLEEMMESAKDMCDEDDDNDYDDDDCMHCTDELITDLLVSCSWNIDKIQINGEDNTEQYTDFLFTFLEDGTLIAEAGGNEIVGTWAVGNSDHGMMNNLQHGIFVDINFDNFPDFSFKWMLYEIEDNNEIDLRFEDNRLEFEKTCIEDKIELVNILNEGTWLVARFNDKGETKTSNYNDFVLDFKEDFTVTATKGDDIVEGTWAVIYDSGKLKLELNFGETIPFNEFNEDWLAVNIQNARVEVNNLDDSGNEESNLVFERI